MFVAPKEEDQTEVPPEAVRSDTSQLSMVMFC